MTIRNRIFDMLPALLVFAFVSAFTTYVTVAYVLQDPLWLTTVSTHQREHAERRGQVSNQATLATDRERAPTKASAAAIARTASIRPAP
ncbi:MAG: hypothetical protein JWM25_583 [Thermoleophilia bacterium]|nr:hypothetical protein [Thermoleophilia bacterium]MCZ4496000.1 hypothetical protein [Thermoleophilia bacterium]